MAGQGLPFYISVQHLAKQNRAWAPAGNCKHYWNTSNNLSFGAQSLTNGPTQAQRGRLSWEREWLTWQSLYVETDNSKLGHSHCRKHPKTRQLTVRNNSSSCFLCVAAFRPALWLQKLQYAEPSPLNIPYGLTATSSSNRGIKASALPNIDNKSDLGVLLFFSDLGDGSEKREETARPK